MVHPNWIALEFQQLGLAVIGSPDAAYGNVNATGSQRCFVDFAKIAFFTVGIRKEPGRAPGPLRYLFYGRLGSLPDGAPELSFLRMQWVWLCAPNSITSVSAPCTSATVKGLNILR